MDARATLPHPPQCDVSGQPAAHIGKDRESRLWLPVEQPTVHAIPRGVPPRVVVQNHHGWRALACQQAP